jgi:hypothetical protein
LRGFTADDCVPLVGDSLRHVVRWKTNGRLPAQKCLVRAHLEKATLYAVTFKER